MSLRAKSWLVPLIFIAACSSEDGSNGGNSPMAGAGGAGGAGGAAGMAGVGGGGAGGASGIGGTGGQGGVAGQVVGGEGGVGGGGTGGGGGEAGGGPTNCDSTVVGAMYSPGGDVLPFPCEPFHPTTNNPYAVRCVDAWDFYDSGYPGDDFCILPPPPDKGVQYGVHPQGQDWYAQVSTGDLSGYQNVPADFILESGGEGERNYYTSLDLPEFKFYRNYPRMRAGSHHMIVSAAEKNANLEAWGAGSAGGLFGGTSLPGAQRPDENTPKTLDKPAEDDGYYSLMPGNTGITFDMHHFNATEGDILKEAWTNVWFEDGGTKKVTGILGLDTFGQVISMNIAPGSTVDYHYTMQVGMRTRIVSLFGHRHAWTTNFSAWIEEAGGDTNIMYQSFDWYDEPTYRYDSLVTNPMPNFDTKMDGGASGITWLEPGDVLHFNCHIEYTDERASAVNAPIQPQENGPLHFANQAFNAEMCILFGQTAEGDALNAPVGGVAGGGVPEPPDWAK